MSKIIGNTTATPTPRSDWNQTDPKKADFILNKPNIEALLDDKADLTHNHEDLYYTKEQTNSALSQKAQVQIITWEDDD